MVTPMPQDTLGEHVCFFFLSTTLRQALWLMPVILANWEVEMGRIAL
jgi:hypothetical protein